MTNAVLLLGNDLGNFGNNNNNETVYKSTVFIEWVTRSKYYSTNFILSKFYFLFLRNFSGLFQNSQTIKRNIKKKEFIENKISKTFLKIII